MCPIFVDSVHNFGRSDDDDMMHRCGLMPNLIKKSWTVSILLMSYFQDRCHDRELVAAHEMTGPVKHFQIKWGHENVMGIT
jgi:hypothetical protein